MRYYCDCEDYGNFDMDCGEEQWCPSLARCITSCSEFCDCQVVTTTTTSTTPPTTTTTTRYPTTTTRYPTTTTRYPTTTTRYPTTTTGGTTTTVPPGVCPDDWIESLEGCFLFHYTGWRWTVDISVFSRSLGLIENLTWREAQAVCEDLGGYLAEIRSQDQQTFMVEILSPKYQ